MANIAWPDRVWVESITMALRQPHKANQTTDDGVTQQKKRGASNWLIRTGIAADNLDDAITFMNAISEANCVVQMPVARAAMRTLGEQVVASRINEEDGFLAIRFVTPAVPPSPGMYIHAGSATFRRIYQIFSTRVDGANTIVRVGPNIRPRGTTISPINSIAVRLATTGVPPWGRLEAIGKIGLREGQPLLRAAPFSVEWNEVPG